MSRICNITSNGFIVDPACLPVLTVNWEIYDVTNGVSLETIQVAPSTSIAGADSYGFFVGGTGEEPSFDLCALDTTTTQIELRGSITDSCQKTSEPCVFTYDIPISAEAVAFDEGIQNNLDPIPFDLSANDTPCSYGTTIYSVGTVINGTIATFDPNTGQGTLNPTGAGVWLIPYDLECDSVVIDSATHYGEVVIAPPENRFTFDGNSSDESEFVNSGAGGEYLDTFEFIKSGSTDPLDAGFTGTLELKLGGDTYSAPYTDGDSLSGLTFTGPNATTAAEITNHLTGTVANGSNLLFSTWDFLNAIGTDVPNNAHPVDIDWCINVLDIYGQGQVNADNTASMPFMCLVDASSTFGFANFGCATIDRTFDNTSTHPGNTITYDWEAVDANGTTINSGTTNPGSYTDTVGSLHTDVNANRTGYGIIRGTSTDNLGCTATQYHDNHANRPSVTEGCGGVLTNVANPGPVDEINWRNISTDNPCGVRLRFDRMYDDSTQAGTQLIMRNNALFSTLDSLPTNVVLTITNVTTGNVIITRTGAAAFGIYYDDVTADYSLGQQLRMDLTFDTPNCPGFTFSTTHTYL